MVDFGGNLDRDTRMESDMVRNDAMMYVYGTHCLNTCRYVLNQVRDIGH